MLEKRIPQIRGYVERKVSKELGDWLVEIRVVSRNLGQLAIGEASAARQREEELRMKQKEAEEQSRLSLRDCVYALKEEEDDDDEYDSGLEGSDAFDLTPLYRAYHIHQTLSLEDRFKRSTLITGSFSLSLTLRVVEDRRRVISRQEVEFLWDLAVGNMCAVVEDQFSRMQTAIMSCLIKD
ncbi:hypothetical protein HID58_090648 [Brassica napus]|uniref:Exocyst complex component EXOC6/Sec15 N-terminal domain-containing protein n=1 Tax=Brassica napus TaxID=3708 RepID=A0ABQ7XC11_BRANA|nr:hypothetical protein HID58_090648 [Brassica napus]